jgi:VWFA-related protein
LRIPFPCVLVFLSLLGSLPAQEHTSAPEVTIRTRTQLVLVPVVVTDKSGKHLTGLKQADFSLLEDGKPRPVGSFEEIVAGGSTEGAAPSKGVFRNFGTDAAKPKRLTIVVIDLLNTRIEDQGYARQQLLKYLEQGVKPDELVSLVILGINGVAMLHDFTSDSQELITAVKIAQSYGTGGPAVNTMATDQGVVLQAAVQANPRLVGLLEHLTDKQGAEKVERTYSAHVTLVSMENLAHAFAGVPGRKSMLWVTGGLPFNLENPTEFGDMGLKAEYNRSFQALNDANISVYPVDARGLFTTSDNIQSRSAREYSLFEFGDLANQVNYSPTGTLKMFAEMTGGVAFYNSNDLKLSFERARDDSGQYYLLGYYLNKEDNKAGWHTIKVKYSGQNANVRARTGFYFDPKNQPSDADQKKSDIKAAVTSPLDFSGVPVTAMWTSTEGEKGKRKIGFALQVPPGGCTVDDSDGNHLSLDFAAIVRDSKGKAVDTVSQTVDAKLPPASVSQIASDGMNYRNFVMVDPGEYKVRFVVRDNITGRTGSVSAPLSVQ